MITALAPIPPRTQIAHQAAQAPLRPFDGQGQGDVTQAELASALVRISAQGAARASGQARTDAQLTFQRIDANHDGRVSAREFLQGISQQRRAAPLAAADGAPPVASAVSLAATPGQRLSRYAAVQSLAMAAGPGWH